MIKFIFYEIPRRFFDDFLLVDEPRLATSGGELPTPRTLSNTFFKVPNGQEAVREGFNTLMSMFWGQFLDHDFVLTPTITGMSYINTL